jgi:Tol biopolymer transport system component
MLELYFDSNRPGGLGGSDIWVSTRASTSDPWGAPTAVTAVNSPSGETTPEVSFDGLTLYLASNRPGGFGDNDIYVSTRSSRVAGWIAPVHVPELSTDGGDTGAAPNAGGLLMVIAIRPVDHWDLYLSSRPSTADAWSAPATISELNTAGLEATGFLSPGGFHLFYCHYPAGSTDRDLYLASRPSLGDSFGTPAELTELNSVANDEDPWVSSDLRHIYFASSRGGNLDIYEAWR